MSSPLFSIITVCYNAQDTVAVTALSVKQQNFTDYEYVVIDGASSDNTLDVLKASGARVDTLVSERDRGIYDAMNKAISLAKGNYLMFLNAGDSLTSPDVLRQLADIVKTSSPDVIYGDTAIVDASRNFMKLRRLRPPKQLTFDSFKQGMLVCHQAFIPRRELVYMYNLQYRFSADFDWCLNILKRSNKNVFAGGVIVDYLNEGATTRNRIKSLKERFVIMCNHYGVFSTIVRHIGFIFRLAVK